MSIKKIHTDQPKEFKFTDESLNAANKILLKYPKENRSPKIKKILGKRIF